MTPAMSGRNSRGGSEGRAAGQVRRWCPYRRGLFAAEAAVQVAADPDMACVACELAEW